MDSYNLLPGKAIECIHTSDYLTVQESLLSLFKSSFPCMTSFIQVTSNNQLFNTYFSIVTWSCWRGVGTDPCVSRAVAASFTPITHSLVILIFP